MEGGHILHIRSLIVAVSILLGCLPVLLSRTGLQQMGTTEEDSFEDGIDGWTLPDKSWQRIKLSSLFEQYPSEIQPIYAKEENIEVFKNNTVLIPYLGNNTASEFVLSTMSRDLSLPESGRLEILFSVLLVGWNNSLADTPGNERGSTLNPKLQVFYDEDMVFDITKAVQQHHDHFSWSSWNQFKMFSLYREPLNMTITVVGSRGTGSNCSLVLLDNFIITIDRAGQNSFSEEGLAPRLEPEADMKENGTWKRIETQANQEAEAEEKERGRPTFCSLLPEAGPCTKNKKRYFFNSTSEMCEEFDYGGCEGNENRFDDKGACDLICTDRPLVEPVDSTLRVSVFTSFETGFEGWDARNWGKLEYNTAQAMEKGIVPPPRLLTQNQTNEVGIMPEYHMFDFRQPQLTQEFRVEKHSTLLIEFQLLVKGVSESGFLAFFLRLDPGFEIYIGNIKVYDFNQHGTNDEHWHRYRLTMNESEVEEHRLESGDRFLLITIKGWLGNGKKGSVVLDNLNLTQVHNDSWQDSGDSLSNSQTINSSNNSPTSNNSNNSSTNSTDHCHKEVDIGICRGKFTRYYYNNKMDACVQFPWSGCGGNDNKFMSEEECMDSCKGSKVRSQIAQTTSDPTIVCLLPPKPGRCGSKFQRFYFEPKTGQCESFTFGGCEENANNFQSQEECHQFCKPVTQDNSGPSDSPQNREDDCQLPRDPGTCSGSQDRFYYDPTTSDCKRFQFSGCGGNRNRFSTYSDCTSHCSSSGSSGSSSSSSSSGSSSSSSSPTTTPQESTVGFGQPVNQSESDFLSGFNSSSCALPLNMGTCTDSLVRYYYSVQEEKCKSFEWTGCGGNSNNFPTWFDCWMSCQPEEEDLRMSSTPGPLDAGKSAKTRQDVSGENRNMKSVAEGEDTSEEDDAFSILPFIRDSDHSPEHICSQPYSEGPCAPLDPANYKKRYYYNSTKGECLQFFYGGCGGNHNNFVNQSDCQAFCSTRKPGEKEKTTDVNSNGKGLLVIVKQFNQSWCFISPRHGTCNSNLPRWYYSRWDNMCKPYNFTGCGGNQNSFNTKSDCEEWCPPVKFNNTETRCERLRNRGECDEGGQRYFFDKYSGKCVKFIACQGLGDTENNFNEKEECETTCHQHSDTTGEASHSERGTDFSSVQHSPQSSEAGTSSSSSAVEAIIVILVLGLVGFGVMLGCRHYRARQELLNYRHFTQDVRPAQEPGSAGPTGGNGSVCFENPVYNSQLYNVQAEDNSDIQIPPLTLGTLGVIPENTETSA